VEIRGAATILDVSFSAKSLSGEEDTWSQCVNELLVELRQCRRRADNLVNRIIHEILLGGNHHGHVTLNNLPNHTGVADQVNNIPSQGATLSGGTTPANAQMASTTAEHKCINDVSYFPLTFHFPSKEIFFKFYPHFQTTIVCKISN
ncbi:unnamed protein product, partial [Schistosoma curassoni]|uniref:IMS_C domain-containing protein n=1 Tax=Schistosoma curassoni TaxID=6186 RepID=A0A183L4U7_9TREM